MSGAVFGLDVYGTLVDPLAMASPLLEAAGDRAAALAARWRATQLEYAFRRGLMRAYADFSVCTLQALRHACAVEGVALSASRERGLLDAYLRLPAYPDAARELDALRSSGARTVAFSNGTESAVRAVLDHAGLLDRFDDIVSVDPLRTFKPDPAVYDELVRRGGATRVDTWLISANGWDVIGAKSAGLRAAWVTRPPGLPFDPWGIEPDLKAGDLVQLARGILPAGA